MSGLKAIPIIRPHTYATNMGPGSEHGGPFYPLGQQYHQPTMLAKQLTKERELGPDPCHNYHLDTSRRIRWNDPKSGVVDQTTMYTYGQPDSHRSCVISYNKDGLTMNSLSHYNKVGAKHMQAQSRSSPFHGYFSEDRRKVPDIHTVLWDNRDPLKASSTDIGNWSPLWYRAVNEMNNYAKYRDATLQQLGLEYGVSQPIPSPKGTTTTQTKGIAYGMVNGEYVPAVTKTGESARSSNFSSNHKYSGYPKEKHLLEKAYMSPISIAASDPQKFGVNERTDVERGPVGAKRQGSVNTEGGTLQEGVIHQYFGTAATDAEADTTSGKSFTQT
eukprot:g3049.t1